MSRRRWTTAAVGTVAVVSTIGVVTLAGRADAVSDTDDSTPAPRPTSTASVGRGDLTTSREFKATVSFGDSWTINTAAHGTVTQHHPVGTVVGFGEELARIDNKPLFLVKGEVPMYRELQKVNTGLRDENGKRLKRQTGADVTQLQTFLIESGYHLDGKLEADGEFANSTRDAVKKWQEAVGLSPTGRVDTSQIVFAPSPVRVTSKTRLGAPFTSLEVGSTTPAVLVETNNRDRTVLAVGTAAAIELADGTELTGTVVEQEQVTGLDGSSVWRSTITPTTDPDGEVTSAAVTVTETKATNVLHVPVSALLALSEGGFAVEVVNGSDTRLVSVELGKVVEARAEVSGGFDEGDEVVVPE